MTHQQASEAMKTPQHSVGVEVQEQPALTLDGELSLSDYVQEVEPTEKTKTAIHQWAELQQETTRTKLAMTLVKFFGTSLVATFVLMGAAAFNPNADKAFIKDLIPQVITPQVTLLAVALGYYFGAKDNEK